MPVHVINKGNETIIRLTANATLNTVSNSTGGNCDISPSDNACRGAYISKVYFSTAGNIKIQRGANLIFTLTGTDHWDLTTLRLKVDQDSGANFNIAFSDTNSSLVMVVNRLYDGGQNPEISRPLT
jgi:hypothetical protein